MSVELPPGGNLNDAVLVGNTVRRRAGPWSPAVHALLAHLGSRGFPAPRVLGFDERGREMLALMPGVGYPGGREPIPDWVVDDARLVQAARLLRRFHEAAASF